MAENNMPKFKLSALCLAMAGGLTATGSAIANEEQADEGIEKIAVTASRRVSTVQEIPVNITALDGDVMKDQNITQLADVARWVPGLSIPDQGGRSDAAIIVRGLNTNSSGPDADGGTVATYVGEIPLFVNMRLLDVERVEVLIGPQGTLYGAGTLGGAIRYLPNKPILDETSGSIAGDLATLAESDDMSSEFTAVFNTPIIEDELGVRVAFSQSNEAGFIDYGYVVKEGGVSLPDPDWSDANAVAANLKKVNDVNSVDTTTARLSLRWTPNEDIDAVLSYMYQKQEVGGRSIVHHGSLADSNPLASRIGKYESGYRYEEPLTREDSLLSLELTADLGFAELTSATGISQYDAEGQRDQTDLLIRLDYSYEEFPAFSSFTREVDSKEIFTQEVRLVSNDESALSWIVGAYYNDYTSSGDSREYTPGFDQYAVDNWGANQLRPDSLEYISVGDTDVTESAVFGEVSFEINEQLTATLGGRLYEYDVESTSAIDLPLFYTLFGDYGPNDINLDYGTVGSDDSGNLLKFNLSYQFNRDVLTYVTVSEGFRIGGANGVGLCPDNIGELDNQVVCALPNEVNYGADTTTNFELGMKSTWFANKFHFNAALFHVEWDNAQVAGATVNGQQPITSNAATAQSSGIEISTRALIAEGLLGFATFSHTKAELTADAPFLFGVIDAQGTALQDHYDGKNGDRLPGAPETQASLGLNYSTEIMNMPVVFNYGMTYQSDVYSKVGLRADGEKLDGYSLSNFSVKVADENWAVTAYIDNMFDEYAYSSVRRDKGDIGLAKFPGMNSNGTEIQRNYGHYLIKPRKIGVKFEYLFDL